MADHLLLPDRIALPTRRQGGAGGASPERNPRRHGEQLRRQLEQAIAVAREIRVVEGVDPGLVFKVRATGRLEDNDWRNRGLTLLGETEDWTYFVLSTEDIPTRLDEKLGQYSLGPDEMGGSAPDKTFLNALEHIEPYGREDRRGPDLPADLASHAERILVDVIVWPSADIGEARRRLSDVRVVLDQFDGEEIAKDERPQYTVLRARLAGPGVDALLGLPVVERVRLPPAPYVEPSDWLNYGSDDPQILVEDGEPVGVIDDGIADGHPLLANGGVGSRQSFPTDYEWQPIGPHGTQVAGLAAFGDFEEPLRSGEPLVRRGPVHEARVLEPHPHLPNRTQFATSTTEHQAVEEAIVTLHRDHGVRVFVLSITDPDPYSGPHVSLWTERLDALIRERKIVVVVAAGNHGVHSLSRRMDSGHDAWRDYPAYLLDPVARVAEPATAALALTAGSIARSDGPQTLAGVARVGDRAIAGVNEVSPFSRSGPGVFKSVKPEVVEYGGNWVVTDTDILETENPGVSAVTLALGPGGRQLRVASGTSFAAPRVARLAADLWSAYPDASANLIRALIGVSTRVPEASAAQLPDEEHRLRGVGYGRPIRELALESNGPRVVMYFDGSMPTETVSVHPIPIPESFARGSASRRIAVSLASDPPVRRQRREYLAGTMSFDLLRNVTPEQIRERYSRQGAQRVDLYTDRRRLDLRPATTRTQNSTLQVRSIRRQRLDVDDGDTYYLAVTHQSASWAQAGTQDYAVAVELVDEDRQEIDLVAEVQRVQLPARVQLRG